MRERVSGVTVVEEGRVRERVSGVTVVEEGV